MVQLNPQKIKALFAKARAAQQKGQLDEAERAYKRLLRDGPKLAEVYFNLGEVFAQRGKIALAAEHFERALKLRPNEAAIWVSYLNLASTHPNPKNFDILRNRAAPVLAKTAVFSYFEGLAAQRDEAWSKAAAFFKAALDGGVRQIRAYAEYGGVLAELKQYDLAIEQFDVGLAKSPNSEMLLFRKAGLLQTMGRIEDARAVAKRAMAVAPRAGASFALYASVTKMEADDPYIGQMKSALKTKRAGERDIPAFGFALAKAMEDSGQSDRVFSYLKQANDAMARAYPYDVDTVRKNAQRVRDLFEKFKTGDAPSSDAAPIFVTGAPRSGTTLVEQILASHSMVEGGGELGIIQPKFDALLISEQSENAVSGTQLLAACKAAADDFGAYIAQQFPDAAMITDKSISSYAFMGFMAQAMPNARFVVVRRDPRDNALSIYKNQFRDGLHRYASKLENIAFFLREFDKMVGFWRDQCPDAFYEIRYEDLVTNPEAQSKALVAAVGLDWEDACLSFYKTKREVRTLSAAQVRQPMYTSSVGAWKRFEADIAPFLKAYGPI